MHLLSLASLRELNDRIVARGGSPVPVGRFRPNIVVDGWDAHQEDDFLRLATEAVELGYSRPAIRCAITTVDQLAGIRAGPEPLRTLGAYRRRDDGITFGAKYSVVRPGRIASGDALTTISRQSAVHTPAHNRAHDLALIREGGRPESAHAARAVLRLRPRFSAQGPQGCTARPSSH